MNTSTSTSPTVAVTAASGHLGRLAVLALLERGAEPSSVVATARDLSKVQDLADLGVDVRRASYDDPASLVAAFTGVERLLFVSGSEVGHRLEQHSNVVDAAKQAGVSLVAYTSAPHAATATYLLATDHRDTEAYLAASGVPFTFLRNSWYFENYTENLGPVLATGSVYGAAGTGAVSAAARRDYAEAGAAVLLAADVAEHAGKVYELGGDEGMTLSDYAAAVAEATGREIGYVDLPVADFRAALESAGLPAPVAEILSDADAGIARGELFDDSRALSTLIGRPTTPLADILVPAVAALEETSPSV